jgi:hypothetical protein
MTEMIAKDQGYPKAVNADKMADPKYADLPGIVRYFDKYCILFVIFAMM